MKRLRRDKKHLRISSELNTLQDHIQKVLQKERGEIMLRLKMFKVIRDLTSRNQMIKIDGVDRSIEKKCNRLSRPVDLLRIEHFLNI